MASTVQICNLALSRLGADTIVSLEDNTPEAKLCSTFFIDLADRVMVQGSWSTTVQRATLAKTINTPVFGFANEFQLPKSPKCLKVLNINENIVTSSEYRIEDDKLLTDSPTAQIRYISRIENTEDYGAPLTEAIEILLAQYLAMPITGDKKIAESLKFEYFESINRNLAIDGQQGSNDIVVTTSLTEVR